MARTEQIFYNKTPGPIYVSVEPWPECFELESGDELRLIWSAPDGEYAAEVSFLDHRNLVILPNGPLDDLEILFNGGSSGGRSWNFKHVWKKR